MKSCIHVAGQDDDERDVEVIARRGGEIVLRTLLPINHADFGFEDVPDCIELRRRGPTGKRSEALSFCGDELGVKPWVSIGPRYSWPLCQNGAFVSPPAATGAAGGEAGVDSDREEPSAAGSSAPRSIPEPSAQPANASVDAPRADPDPPRHREYGCTTAPGGQRGDITWVGLLIALLVFVRTRTRK